MKSPIVEKQTHPYGNAALDYRSISAEPSVPYCAGSSVIETDLTREEKAWVRKGRRQYREHPETFVPLESIV